MRYQYARNTPQRKHVVQVDIIPVTHLPVLAAKRHFSRIPL